MLAIWRRGNHVIDEHIDISVDFYHNQLFHHCETLMRKFVCVCVCFFLHLIDSFAGAQSMENQMHTSHPQNKSATNVGCLRSQIVEEPWNDLFWFACCVPCAVAAQLKWIFKKWRRNTKKSYSNLCQLMNERTEEEEERKNIRMEWIAMYAQPVQCTRSHNIFPHLQEEEHRPVMTPYGCCVCSSYWRLHAHAKHGIQLIVALLFWARLLRSQAPHQHSIHTFMPMKKSDTYGRFTCETD